MRKITMLLVLLVSFTFNKVIAQEKVFAGYFDIEAGSPKNTEVVGRIHLERNKDVLTNPIPKTYQFAIASQKDNIFNISTQFDPMGRDRKSVV